MTKQELVCNSVKSAINTGGRMKGRIKYRALVGQDFDWKEFCGTVSSYVLAGNRAVIQHGSL